MLLLAGCVDDYVSTSKGQKDAEANPNDFSLQEAHEFFDKAMELAPVTRSGKRLRSDGVSFPTGEFNTLWNNARKGQRKHVVFYDFPIEPQMRYKARRMVKNAKGRKVSQEVRVYQRLMIAKDLRRQKRAVYIVTFIPEAKSSGKVRCEQFMRGKHNGHYSGVVLYLNPYNYRPVRVDRYKNGVQTGGVFLAGDVKDAVSKVAYAQELLGNVQIAQRQLVAPMSFDENQEDNDFGGGGGSWNWDESDLTQTGDGEWTYHGHDAYGNEQDYTVIDTDGDGKPDSIFIDPNPPVDPDPGTEEPDPDWGWGDGEDGNGGDEWETTDPDDSSDGSKDPVDPNPGGGSSSGGETTEPNKPSNKKTVNEIQTAAQAAVNNVVDKYGMENGTFAPHCNAGVSEAFRLLYNDNALSNMNANSMITYWTSHPEAWEEVSMQDAQILANQGYFVVAGWINPTGGSGHVVVIVPGEPVNSTSWDGKVPLTMDTGSNKRYVGKPINQSFSSKKKDNIKYFKYKRL